MRKSLVIGLGWTLLVGCSGAGQEDGSGPFGGGGGNASGGGTSSSSTGGGNQIPNQPQPWVDILEPGQSTSDENSDQDGWCVGGEGVYACDDGAPPGSGGTPPPGWSSSSSGTSGTSGNTSGGASSGGASSGGAGTSGGAPQCLEEDFNTGNSVTPQMLLVVDKSGSMDETPAGSAQSKWTQVVSVLNAVTQSLESSIDFGLALFPSGGANSCSEGNVVVNVGGNRAGAVAAALAASGPGGGTPTGASLQEARAYLAGLDQSRPRVVVLATDGAPNCSTGYNPATCVCTNPQGCDDSRNCLDQSGAVGAVTALASAGISTFVVGIPGTDAFGAVLDQMAIAGGTALPAGGPRYYRTTSQSDISNALEQIGTRVASCRFQLNGPVTSGTPLTVTIDGIPVNRAPLHNDGYDITGSNNTLEFFGSACARLSNGANHNVHVEYCFTPEG